MIREETNQEEKKDTEADDSELRCRYCCRKMNPFDFKTFHGVCGKCRETKDWKDILDQLKE